VLHAAVELLAKADADAAGYADSAPIRSPSDPVV
jgi:hypothetical protein